MRRRTSRRPRWALLVGLTLARAAAAQPGRLPAPPPDPAPSGQDLAVDDPLLTPPAPAPTELAGWDEARRLLGSGATALRRADAAVAAAEARVRQARADLLPRAELAIAGQLDLLHPGTAPNIPAGADYEPTSPLGTAAVTARQPLVDLAARRGVAAARASARSAALSRTDVDRQLARDLAHAILAVRAAGRAAELDRLGLRQALERAAITRRTFQLGAATDLDVVRVEQDVAVARAAVIGGDEDLRVAHESLGLLLGVDGEVGVADALTGDALVAALAAQCRPLGAGELRADLAAAAAEVDAAAQRTAQVRAGYYPSLDLATSLSAFTTDPAPGRIPTWIVALQLTVPLWEGGLRGGLVAERAAAEALARTAAEDSRRAARVEVARARRGGEVSTALVLAATEARALAERVDAMTRRSFQIGRATSLELVQSAGALRQADLALTARQFELEAARVDAVLAEARCEP